MDQYKPELGRFYGDSDPKVWVFQAEHYFNFYGFSRDSWLSMPYVYFKGEARAWFDWLYRNNQFYDWEHFKEKLAIHYQEWTFANSVDHLHSKLNIKEQGLEILHQLEDLRDAFSACATKLAAHEFSTVESTLEDARNSALLAPLPQLDDGFSDEDSSIDVVLADNSVTLLPQVPEELNKIIPLADIISSGVTQLRVSTVEEDDCLDNVADKVFDICFQGQTLATEVANFREFPRILVCHAATTFNAQGVLPNFPFDPGSHQLFDENSQEDSPVEPSQIETSKSLMVPLVNSDVSSMIGVIKSDLDHTAARAPNEQLNFVVVPDEYDIRLDMILACQLFKKMSDRCCYSKVLSKLSARETFEELCAPTCISLWCCHALALDFWVDTGQKEIILAPWEFEGHINTQFVGRDPATYVVDRFIFAKASIKEDCILVFRKLKEYYGMSFPFDPGALLKQDHFRSSWLNNERGVFDDIIDRNLVVVVDKNSEHTGKSVLADAILIMHSNDIQIKANLLRELHMEQYLLFGGDILRDGRSGVALAMDRFDIQLQEFQVKKIEQMLMVLEFVNTIHNLCAILGIDFLSIVTKIYPRINDLTSVNSRQLATSEADKKKKIAGPLTISLPLRFSDINEVFMQASGIRNIAAIVYEFLFHLKLGDYSCFLGIPLLDGHMRCSKVSRDHTILMFVQELKIKVFALDQLYGEDVSNTRDSMVFEKCLDLLVLLGLLYVHITGHVEYVPSSSKVWDPGWKYCTLSCILIRDLATAATTLIYSWLSSHLGVDYLNNKLVLCERANKELDNCVTICFSLLLLLVVVKRTFQKLQGFIVLTKCTTKMVEFVKLEGDQLVHYFVCILGVIWPGLFGEIEILVLAVYVHKTGTQFVVDDWFLVKLQPYQQQFLRLQRCHNLGRQCIVSFNTFRHVATFAYKWKFPEASQISHTFRISMLNSCNDLLDRHPTLVQNLEDKVLISGWSNVMNTDNSVIVYGPRAKPQRCQTSRQPNKRLTWDPGPLELVKEGEGVSKRSIQNVKMPLASLYPLTPNSSESSHPPFF